MQKIINIMLATAMMLFIISCSKDDSNPVEPEKKPIISSISSDSVHIGNLFTIYGTNFGTVRDSSIVSFGGAIAINYTSWSDTLIKVKIPEGAKSGFLWAVVNGLKSNEVDFKVFVPLELTIGTQIWMTKNLDVAHYRNGDPIPQVLNPTEWANLKTGAWCYYNNDPALGAIYGKLYNWYAVNDQRGLAPAGWHVPTDVEWTELENCLIANGYNYDGTTTGNKIAKALATASGWTSSSATGAIGNTDYPANRNATSFSALPGGYRLNNGTYYSIGYYCNWWSATEINAAIAWHRYLSYKDTTLYRNHSDEGLGFSVRCVRD